MFESHLLKFFRVWMSFEIMVFHGIQAQGLYYQVMWLFSSSFMSNSWDPMDCSTPGFPVLHYLPESARLMSVESVILSNHFILCRHLLLLPSIFPIIRVFSNESALCIRWLQVLELQLQHQSPSEVILEPKKIKSVTVSFFSFCLPWSDGTRCHDVSFLNVEF